jgi:tRNA threonylcarbamoyladenosine biosynthesis protein TsaB
MLLAIDTSTRKAILAIDGNGGRTVRQFEPRMTQRLIFSELASLLGDDILDRLTGIVIGLGPGSFTGVKIGVMAAKSLAWSRGIPIVGVGSLDAVAAGMPAPLNFDSLLIVAVPSTRGEAYIRAYRHLKDRWTGSGEIIDISLQSSNEPDWLPANPVIVSGEAAVQTSESIGKYREVSLAPEDLRYPSADGLFALAREKFETGNIDDPLYLAPDYVRLSQPDRLSDREMK